MKLVSVIIPCYRNSKTLGRAIDSVIAQTYPFVEIVVVNDCSPETKDIETALLRYSDVRYLRNSTNVGLAGSRNNGLAIARGEYIAFLDADDEYHSEKIEIQVAALEPNTVVTCGLTRLLSGGEVRQWWIANRTVQDANHLIYRNTLNGAGLLASRELLMEHGGYDSSLRSCEDWDLWLRLLSSGVKVKSIGKPLYYYYENPTGLTQDLTSISHWNIEVVKRHSARADAKWRSSHRYPAMVVMALLRYIWKSELSNDLNFRLQVQHYIRNSDLLNDHYFLRVTLLLIARLRVAFLASLLRR